MSDEQLQFGATAGIAPTNSQQVSLEDAFNQVVTSWETPETPLTTEDTTETKDTLTTTVGTTIADDTTSTEDVSTETPSDTKEEVSSHELYERMLREKEAQIGLYKSRLAQLSQQYQQIKQDSKQDISSVPDKVKELKELYPEIAEAMEQLIDYKVGDPRKIVEDTVNQKAGYVQQEINQIRSQQNLSQVLSAHPDLPQLINSGSLYNWVNTLDPVAKYGAQYCIQYGTPSDVINLLTTYKSQVKNQQNKTTKEPLVNKVVNALGVPSNKVEPTIFNQPQIQKEMSLKEAFDELAKGYGK